MSKSIPSVQKYMTYVPKSIGFDRPLSQAMEVMRELRIRHLPVLKGGELVGILTDRDIKLVTSFEKVDPETMRVDEACSFDPYMTKPSAPLSEVAAHMAEHKYGCALVVDNQKLVGILTEVDVCRALADVLENRMKH